MPVLLLIVFSFFNALIMIKSSKFGMMVYFIFCIICPNAFQNGNYLVSYEILASIPIILIGMFQIIYHKKVKWDKKVFPYFALLIIVIISTIISAIVHGCDINLVGLYACIRYPMLFYILLNSEINEKEYIFLLKILLLANYVMCVIQLFVPRFYLTFNKLFLKRDFRYFFEKRCHERFTRLFAFFSSPSIAAYFFMLGVIIFFIRIHKKDGNKYINWFFFTFSVIFGIGTATKTFTYALVILFLFSLFWFGCQNRGDIRIHMSKKQFTYIASSLLTICISIGVLVWQDVRIYSTIPFPSKVIYALEDRFGVPKITSASAESDVKASAEFDVKEGGSAVHMIESLQDYEYLIGVGETAPRGEHVVDSALMIMIHRCGVVGAIILLAWQCMILVLCLKKSYAEGVALILIILLMQLAIPTIYCVTGVLCMGYLFEKLYKTDSRDVMY